MTQATTLLGLQIGDYQLVEFLGAGGMGEVYRAVHTRLNRPVAVKVLHKTRSPNTFVERFRNEARIQADLKHPNIVTLYDFVEYDGRLCIIMEYVDGPSLDVRIRQEGRVPVDEALRLFQPVVEALNYTHRQGVVHRDVKPHNVKISRNGEVKLLDFGIAKGEMTPGLTAVGAVVGTPEYLSPEQLRGKPADPRSDVWALGVMLYEMVTGTIPFEAPSLIDLYRKIDEADYARPSSLASGVPPSLEALVARCLQRRPANRYQSAGALLADVKRCAGELEARAPRRSTVTQILTRLKNPLAGRSQTGVPRLRLPRLKGLSLNGFVASVEQYWHYYVAGLAAVLLLVVVMAVLPALQNGSAVGPQTEDNLGPPHTVMIEAIGMTADVYRDGQRVGTTPYSLQTRIGEHVELTLRHEGYHDELLDFDVTVNTKSITVPLRRNQ